MTSTTWEVHFQVYNKKITYAYTYIRRRQWHPTPVLLPGESQGQESLVGCHLWGRTELDTTEADLAAAATAYCSQ